MSKIAEYLQEHLSGEVSSSPEIRRHLSHDASILHLAPAMVVYPRGESDVRKTIRFCWQLAERGRALPITARGGGSDTSGAAITNGILLMFKAHMNRILALDPKKAVATVEPGITYDKLQQTLYTHGLFLPAAPASGAYATIGGGLANNAVGDNSLKYGDTAKYVKGLRVALSNGELIETEPLSKKELSRKMGLSSFEGQIYRALDSLLEENNDLVDSLRARQTGVPNAIGYNVTKIKDKEHFDLTPLLVGSQGTLGIITEATLSLMPHRPEFAMGIISLSSLRDFAEVLPKILDLKPSGLDFVNRSTIEQVFSLNDKLLAGTLEARRADLHLFVEFDGLKESSRKRCMHSLQKLAQTVDAYCYVTDSAKDQEKITKIRQSVSVLLTEPNGQAKAVPVAEDVCVPPSRLAEFLDEAQAMCTANGVLPAMWGHAGTGIVRLHPMLDLAQLGDRQKLFKLSESLYSLAAGMGGSITAAAGDGRTRSPYTKSILGLEGHELMQKIKAIFDPHQILNPGVKFTSLDELKAMVRSDYTNVHRHEHLPRS